MIFDIKKFAIHDGPGIRTTVFFKGCPLACRLCHNPESQSFEKEVIHREGRCVRCGACIEACPAEARRLDGRTLTRDPERCTACGACMMICPAEAVEVVGREMTVNDVMGTVEADVVFYDESGGGATFSGGEPLAQPDFLGALLEACRERGIHTAVDTSGMADPEVLCRIRAGTDLFLYDLKWIDDGKHRAYTGVSNARILDNLKDLSKAGADIVLRIPFIPGVNDDEENIAGIGVFASSLERPHPVDLLPYHEAGREKYNRLNRIYRLPDTAPPDRESLARAAAALRKHGLEVTVRGESNDHE